MPDAKYQGSVAPMFSDGTRGEGVDLYCDAGGGAFLGYELDALADLWLGEWPNGRFCDALDVTITRTDREWSVEHGYPKAGVTA